MPYNFFFFPILLTLIIIKRRKHSCLAECRQPLGGYWSGIWCLCWFPTSSPGGSGQRPLTECLRIQQNMKKQHLLKAFVPECDEFGAFKSLQCDRSAGICWCVDKYGREIVGSRTRASQRRDCDDENRRFHLTHRGSHCTCGDACLLGCCIFERINRLVWLVSLRMVLVFWSHSQSLFYISIPINICYDSCIN